MNYRQWKKNYKKKHGYNPPLEEDKRQQVKAARKALKNTGNSLGSTAELAQRIVPVLLRAASAIFDAFSTAFNRAGKVAKELADNYEVAAAVYDTESEVKL